MPLSAEMMQKKAALTRRWPTSSAGRISAACSSSAPVSLATRKDSVLGYMNRLAGVADEVKDKLVVIPRVYTNKPRTKGTGYKGLLHSPDPEAQMTCLRA